MTEIERLLAIEEIKQVKAKYPQHLTASVLLESDIPYDSLVQVMDTVRVRVLPAAAGGPAAPVQAELFPEISVGDAPT